MTILEADHERRYDVPGVPGPAKKPVDIDASKTGFRKLRSLRIYRFDEGSVIDGHAEDDEVFVVMTAGTADIKIGFDEAMENAVIVSALAAPGRAEDVPFVAYLPPHSVYKLSCRTAADVAYARATPRGPRREAALFSATRGHAGESAVTLFEDSTHAECLRLKVLHVPASEAGVTVCVTGEIDDQRETLVHAQGSPAEGLGQVIGDGPTVAIKSWQTVAASAGEQVCVKADAGAEVRLLAISAA